MTSKSKAARAIADVTEGVILARVEIAAPPERVFRALTTEELTKWWGADEAYRTTRFAIDLRPGGAWRSDGKGADGHEFHVAGEVLEVEPPRRLVQTWRPSWDDGAATTITYALEPLDDSRGTRVTVRHAGFAGRAASCENHANGWERVLDWLGGYVAAPAPASRYFLLRLLAPRPTFAQDMSADERAVMGAHGAYLRGLLAEGRILAFGPVGDPAGAWGLGLVRVRDEAEVAAIVAEDPTIQSGRGFRYETIPMLALVHT